MNPIPAAVVALGLGAVLLGLRAVTWSGALAGALLLHVLLVGGGLPVAGGMALLVGVGQATSVWGRERKARLGVAQERDGRRTAANALANVGPAALCIVAGGADAAVAALGALAASLADTVGSELGTLAPTWPRRLLLGPPVPPGTNGGMSWRGTGAGLVAAGCVGVLAWPVAGGSGLLAVSLGGLAGSVADSVLGDTVEHRLPRRWANHGVNGAASAIGGLATHGLWVGLLHP